MNKPTIVFVHGAWHNSQSFQPVTYLLRQYGFSTVSMDLPSVGANPPHKDISENVAVVRRAVEDVLDNKGNNVILVAHSAGGIVMTNAAQGFSEKDRKAAGKTTYVQKLLYVCSFLLPKGQCLNDQLPDGKHPPFYNVKYVSSIPVAVVRQTEFQTQNDYLYLENPEEWMYHDVPEDERKRWCDMLKKHESYQCNMSPVEYEAYKEIPTAYIICSEDRAIPAAAQEHYVKSAGVTETLTLKTGHMPFLVEPKAVAGFIRQISTS